MTIFVQIQEGDATAGSVVDNWTPWIDCKPRQLNEVIGLAAHRHMRNRGGAGDQPYKFTVYAYPDTVEKHANGHPKSVSATTYVAHKEAAA